MAEIVRKHCDRIAFAHIRNVKHFPNGDFSEASHRDCDGDTGILDIVKAYHDCGFEGYIRPDHGRQLWGEGPAPAGPATAVRPRPGYHVYVGHLGYAGQAGRGEEGQISPFDTSILPAPVPSEPGRSANCD